MISIQKPNILKYSFYISLSLSVSQDRGQSAGDGPDARVQEDAPSAGQARRHLPQGAGTPQADHQGHAGRHARVSVSVP